MLPRISFAYGEHLTGLETTCLCGAGPAVLTAHLYVSDDLPLSEVKLIYEPQKSQSAQEHSYSLVSQYKHP